jgi:hypothetical protein
MPFLLKAGKFVTLDGKLVTTGDPANCICCDKAPCGVTAASGGEGVTVREFQMPKAAGEVDFTYDSFGIPDAYRIEGGGQVLLDIPEVSGSATRTFQKPAGVTSVKVTVTGPDGTAWTYTIGCPKPEPKDGNPLP